MQSQTVHLPFFLFFFPKKDIINYSHDHEKCNFEPKINQVVIKTFT